jgi:glycine cleavage system H protein
MQSSTHSSSSFWKKGILVLCALALALLALPALGLMALASRVVLPLAIFAFLALLFSPRFRDWLGFEKKNTPFAGLTLAKNVLLHPQHSWARFYRRRNVYQVGSDDLMQAALGPIDGVTLPVVGANYRQGDPLYEIHSRGRRVIVRSPVGGTVIDSNGALAEHPQRINHGPYDQGWVAEIWPNARGGGQEDLLRKTDARSFMHLEVERLMAAAMPSLVPQETMADGGLLAEDIYLQLDDESWERIAVSFFGSTTE